MRPLTKFFRRDEMSMLAKKYVFSNSEIEDIKDIIIRN